MATPQQSPESETGPNRTGLAVLAWVWVGAPLAYGVYELVLKVKQLFTG
jgi:hypothetical protein